MIVPGECSRLNYDRQQYHATTRHAFMAKSSVWRQAIDILFPGRVMDS